MSPMTADEYDPTQTKLKQYANNDRWGDENYYWQFRNGEFELSIKATDFPEYDAAKAEFDRRVLKYLSAPSWRRSLVAATYYVHPRRPLIDSDQGYLYLDVVSFDDEAQTITLRIRKPTSA